MSNKIEVVGLGVHLEVYRTKDKYTDLEMLIEAEKTLKREIMRRQQHETRTGIDNNRPA